MINETLQALAKRGPKSSVLHIINVPNFGFNYSPVVSQTIFHS